MTRTEARKHFERQMENFGGEHREAMETALKVFKRIDLLQSEYRAYHYNSEYWRAVKSVLDALEVRG